MVIVGHRAGAVPPGTHLEEVTRPALARAEIVPARPTLRRSTRMAGRDKATRCLSQHSSPTEETAALAAPLQRVKQRVVRRWATTRAFSPPMSGRHQHRRDAAAEASSAKGSGGMHAGGTAHESLGVQSVARCVFAVAKATLPRAGCAEPLTKRSGATSGTTRLVEDSVRGRPLDRYISCTSRPSRILLKTAIGPVGPGPTWTTATEFFWDMVYTGQLLRLEFHTKTENGRVGVQAHAQAPRVLGLLDHNF